MFFSIFFLLPLKLKGKETSGFFAIGCFAEVAATNMKVLVLLLAFVGASLADEAYEKSCDLPPDRGMCLAYMPKYYYDAESGTCKKFIYGGCQGNGNRYDTEEECLANCAATGTVDRCHLKPETGMCRGYFPMFHYDAESGECKKFIYGGCGGNDNRFVTKEKCQEACGQRAAEEEEEDVCTLEPDGGLCRAYFPMFYFDSKTGECKEFIYGGCGGNGNRFGSKKECYQKCSAVWEADDRCSQEPETGPCRGYFPRYYFNKNKGVCEEFIYGGCKGNSNNYKTYEECADACGAP